MEASTSGAPRPDWLAPFPTDPPLLNAALDACYNAFADCAVGKRFCRQCFDPESELRIRRASRDLRNANPEAFSRIFFEHPSCSGGIETHKCFATRAIETLLYPGGATPDRPWGVLVVEQLVCADLWFWPTAKLDALRALAARLFLDWFERGEYGLEGARAQHEAAFGDTLPFDPTDDIMDLCAHVLIDPVEIVDRLAAIDTVHARTELIGQLYSGTRLDELNYSASDTGISPAGEDGPHIVLMRRMAAYVRARGAGAVERVVTRDLLVLTAREYEKVAPELAKEAAELLDGYEARVAKLAKRKGFDDPPSMEELPRV